MEWNMYDEYFRPLRKQDLDFLHNLNIEEIPFDKTEHKNEGIINFVSKKPTAILEHKDQKVLLTYKKIKDG